jgi:diacylglycerol kinase family enzyme
MMERRGARLSVQAGDVTIDTPQAVLISNNPYAANDLTELGRRPRLDLGTLGVIGVSVRSTRQAVSLLRRTSQHGLTRATGTEVVVQADTPTVPVGVDGEALTMDVPVRCTSVPAALRVRVPRHRPGVAAPHPRLDWVRLRQLALAGKGT